MTTMATKILDGHKNIIRDDISHLSKTLPNLVNTDFDERELINFRRIAEITVKDINQYIDMKERINAQ